MSDLGPTAAARFGRVRRTASAILLALVAVFVGSHFVPQTLVTGLVRAMAEAGMVGGLADWFAVEALFRRPLGLPIPHTALLPRNQARAAENVGRFFETHFLEPAALEARVRQAEPARRIAAWAARPANAAIVARQLVDLATALVAGDPPPRVVARGRAWLRQRVLEVEPAADVAIAAEAASLARQAVRSRFTDDALQALRGAVEQSREAAVGLVKERSRWWIAASVDRRVAAMAVAGVLSLLDEMQSRDSDLRRRFEAAFDGIVETMLADGTLARAVGEARRHLARSGALDDLALRLATAARDRLALRLSGDPEEVAAPLAAIIAEAAAGLARDPAAAADLDRRLAAIAGRLVAALRPSLGGYVAEVIAGWKPDELIDRFEAELGPDLQFIRINGAVLGALIGGVLFAANLALG